MSIMNTSDPVLVRSLVLCGVRLSADSPFSATTLVALQLESPALRLLLAKEKINRRKKSRQA